MEGAERTSRGTRSLDPASAVQWTVRLVQVAGDALAVMAAFFLGHATYAFLGFTKDVRPYEFYAPLSALAALVFLVIYERLGLYRPQASVLNIEEVRGITRGVLSGSVLCLAASFYYRDAGGFELSRLILTFSLGWLLLLANAMRMLIHKGQELLHRHGVGCRRVLLIGTGELGHTLLKRLTGNPQFGLVPVGMLSEDPARVGESIQGQTGQDHTRVRVLGDLAALDRLVDEGAMDDVLLASAQLEREQVDHIQQRCEAAGVEFRFIPDFMGLLFQDLDIEIFDGIPVMRRRRFHERPLYDALKRLFDIAFSGAVLLALSPLFVLVGIFIKRDSDGPVFFTQDRVGKDGKIFTIYKFRSMYVETPQYEFHPKSGEDPRLTPIGRWLRRLSLDELPQFLNVLKGDMSVVGPRPEMPFIVQGYTPFQRNRLQVKPGITGLWQISADRSRMIHENMDYDVFYVHNRGLLLDLIIVFETCFMVVRGVGAH